MARMNIVVIVAGLLVSSGGLARAEDVASKWTDVQIMQHIKDKLAHDDPKIASAILVSVHDGVVTLTGHELAPEDIGIVMRDAKDTEGVVRIENRLKMG